MWLRSGPLITTAAAGQSILLFYAFGRWLPRPHKELATHVTIGQMSWTLMLKSPLVVDSLPSLPGSLSISFSLAARKIEGYWLTVSAMAATGPLYADGALLLVDGGGVAAALVAAPPLQLLGSRAPAEGEANSTQAAMATANSCTRRRSTGRHAVLIVLVMPPRPVAVGAASAGRSIC